MERVLSILSRRALAESGPAMAAPNAHGPAWQSGLLAFAVLLVCRLGAGQESTPFRVGFSSAMFTDVNENDAKAAVKAWGQSIARERGIPTDPETRIFKDIATWSQALRTKSVDAIGITVIEYAVLSREVPLAPVFVTYTGGRAREQYFILVHQDSKIERLAELRGRSLTIHENSRVRLALPWLDTVLIQEGGKPAVAWLRKITPSPKLPKVVLPVFFRQSDACVVTRSGFETMVELNPQLGRQLKILARSPEVVPAVFCFRADYAAGFKEDLFAGVRDLHKSAAGQQVLTVFQSDKIEDQPMSCLDSALELLATHQKLCGCANGTNVDNSVVTRPAGEAQL